MYKIKALNNIADEGLELLDDQYQVVETDDDIDAIVLRSYKMQGYVIGKTVNAVVRAGAGVNNIPVEEYSEKGIVVFNTPGANANGVKEMVIAGLLLTSRDIPGSIEFAKTLINEGDQVGKIVEQEKSNFVGPEIQGKVLGVIGLGAIGAQVANSAHGLGMKVLGHDPFISVDAAWGLDSAIIKAKSIEDVYKNADYITVHVPLIEGTKEMINEQTLDLMKDGVRILNFSRGGLVNDDAILKALESGKVSKYITDFPNEKTLKMPNTISIPHLGASTPESEINCAIMAIKQLREYIENGNIINSVNYPRCNNGVCETDARITINHKNVPNMVGQITSVIANSKLNIADMINKSRKEWAYTILDVDGVVKDEIIQQLRDIEGVVKVRVI